MKRLIFTLTIQTDNVDLSNIPYVERQIEERINQSLPAFENADVVGSTATLHTIRVHPNHREK